MSGVVSENVPNHVVEVLGPEAETVTALQSQKVG